MARKLKKKVTCWEHLVGLSSDTIDTMAKAVEAAIEDQCDGPFFVVMRLKPGSAVPSILRRPDCIRNQCLVWGLEDGGETEKTLALLTLAVPGSVVELYFIST